MVLTLSSTYIPPANTHLTPADQILVAKPLTDLAKDAVASAGPAAVYHPSADAEPMQSLEAIDTWVGRSASRALPRIIEIAKGAQSVLNVTFKTFQSTLAATYPDLAGTKYGFTVEADGALKVLNEAGQLSSSQTQRLTLLLNQSKDLKAAAITFRDASIDMVDADSPWSGNYLGRYSLTKENFAATIDLVPLFNKPGSVPPQEYADGFFFSQLEYKGELATRETETAMFERRGAQGLASLY
ncbi:MULTISPECIES: hypothetical protein [Pseudomonas]|uniref:hypothetical protein n=1 Tax=unclassified Pseudomonas TaxID=196821 RepID=UPI001868F2F0|nr:MULTISPECIES: hypothetical protein [unclassified Pseudomonas]